MLLQIIHEEFALCEFLGQKCPNTPTHILLAIHGEELGALKGGLGMKLLEIFGSKIDKKTVINIR